MVARASGLFSVTVVTGAGGRGVPVGRLLWQGADAVDAAGATDVGGLRMVQTASPARAVLAAKSTPTMAASPAKYARLFQRQRVTSLTQPHFVSGA